MKKFIFRLEALLRVRRMKENQLQRELAFIQQKLSQAQEKENTLSTQIQSLLREIQQKRDEKKFHFQETYTQILNHLSETKENINQQQLSFTRQITLIQEQLKQAIQERKVIEKIKRKHYSGWRNRTDTEGERLDELGLNKTAPHQ